VSDRRPQTTFLGPVTWDEAAYAWTVLLLQSGGTPVALKYPSKNQAIVARQTLGKNAHTHRVPTNELLLGIYEALQEAMSQPPRNTSPDTE
jgi:hypothetical protein